MKHISNTVKARMYINKSTIYFSNGNQFVGKHSVACLTPEPKLMDYCIQGMRNLIHLNKISWML